MNKRGQLWLLRGERKVKKREVERRVKVRGGRR
jgi:hypothetical protein